MYVYLCLYVGVGVCEGKRLLLNVFLDHYSLFLIQGFSLNLKLVNPFPAEIDLNPYLLTKTSQLYLFVFRIPTLTQTL